MQAHVTPHIINHREGSAARSSRDGRRLAVDAVREHSSYAQAVAALSFYANKGVPANKMVLGVPFYGYCWGNCGGVSSKYVLYKDLLASYPNASSSDWINANGAQYSYNGLATIRSKAALAKQYGGIMIWELAGDVSTSCDQSLLRAIDSSVR